MTLQSGKILILHLSLPPVVVGVELFRKSSASKKINRAVDSLFVSGGFYHWLSLIENHICIDVK